MKEGGVEPKPLQSPEAERKMASNDGVAAASAGKPATG